MKTPAEQAKHKHSVSVLCRLKTKRDFGWKSNSERVRVSAGRFDGRDFNPHHLLPTSLVDTAHIKRTLTQETYFCAYDTNVRRQEFIVVNVMCKMPFFEFQRRGQRE